MIDGKKLKEWTYKCSQCGAVTVFDSITQTLKCEYCGSQKVVEVNNNDVVENDFESAMIKLHHDENKLKTFTAKCPECASSFTIKPYQRTTICPYCSTPVLTNLDIFYDLQPEALLTFKLTKKEAKLAFKKWIGSLWFAPNDLEKYLEDKEFEAIYLPFWTYDSDTVTHYTGQRGDIYYVTVQKRVFINGREEIRDVQEQRIRWSYASGTVRHFFDDILVGASKSVTRSIIDSLEPWDLSNLVSFKSELLTGYESETYQVGLDFGFKEAGEKMKRTIIQLIRYDIGGDRQQIDSLKTYYNNTTFKYILLPIYKAEFKYKNKTYDIAINARTGKVSGKRPYSYLKIISLVIFIMIVFAGLFSYIDFQDSGYTNYLDYLQAIYSKFFVENTSYSY